MVSHDSSNHFLSHMNELRHTRYLYRGCFMTGPFEGPLTDGPPLERKKDLHEY